jgi:RND family efflux transporter MFP subunit
MLIVLSLYFLIVWLVFIKLKLLPWSRGWKTLVYSIAVTVALVVVGALQHYTPASSIAVVQTDSQQIYPAVSGRVVSVAVQNTQSVRSGEILFEIDPAPFQYQVDKFTAVVTLAEIKLDDMQTLVRKEAASRRQIDRAQAELDQARAELADARYNMEQAQVRAPADGTVMGATLEIGQYVGPSQGVLNFISADGHWIIAGVKQNGLVRIAPGQPVSITFASSPGEIYSSTVALVPTDSVAGQMSVEDVNDPFAAVKQAGNIYPVRVNFPEAADPSLRRGGAIAAATFFTDEGNPINALAKILQWISTWLAYIF